VAVETAVSKPKVMTVAGMSLSMVLGTPTTGSPLRYSRSAMPRVPSPPMAMSAPRPRARKLRTTSAERSVSTTWPFRATG
jgi:hypothetical protein